MKTAAALLLSCASVALVASTAHARQMHADIDYARYLQEVDAVTDELDAWMDKFHDDAKTYGWLPQAESRDADEVQEDRKQRFFMAKQLVSKVQAKNPDAQFSTDSPFTLLTTDEFAKYIKNSYIAGRRRHDDGRNEFSFGDLFPTSWGNANGGDDDIVDTSIGGADTGSPTEESSGADDPASYSFEDMSDSFDNSNQPNGQADPATEAPSAPSAASSPSDPTDAPSSGPDTASSDTATTPAPASDESGEIGADSSGVDWSTNKCMPPVQTQGQCGSCWAFATVAAAETGKCIATKASSFVKLSEENLAGCDTNNQGCNGGATDYAMQYIEQNGVCSAADVPYTMGDGHAAKCTGCTKVPSGIKSYSEITGEAGLVKALDTHPVVISVASGNEAWKQYVSGVLSSCDTTEVDHGVLAVGYDATSIKIRNSWGADWGEKGYIRIKRGGQGDGICSMYNDMKQAKY